MANRIPYNLTDRALQTDKTERILAAALVLFAERGFHGTAVPAIAEKAGLGTGTLYRYFVNKEAIVNAVYCTWKNALGEHILDGFPADGSPREQFHHFWQRAVSFAEKHPLAFKFLELHHHAPYLGGEAKSIEERILAPAFQFFERTARDRVTKPYATEVLGAVVWGALVGMVKASWEGRIKLSPDVIDAGEQCCWEAIRL